MLSLAENLFHDDRWKGDGYGSCVQNRCPGCQFISSDEQEKEKSKKDKEKKHKDSSSGIGRVGYFMWMLIGWISF